MINIPQEFIDSLVPDIPEPGAAEQYSQYPDSTTFLISGWYRESEHETVFCC